MKPTRRTVLKTGAWSLPLLAAAVAAPAAAASDNITAQMLGLCDPPPIPFESGNYLAVLIFATDGDLPNGTVLEASSNGVYDLTNALLPGHGATTIVSDDVSAQYALAGPEDAFIIYFNGINAGDQVTFTLRGFGSPSVTFSTFLDLRCQVE